MANQVKKKNPELGKYLLWKYFSTVPSIRKYMPATKRLSYDSLQSFLNQYGAVYIKPTAGSQGRGVSKAWRDKDKFWFVQERGHARSFSNVKALYNHVQGIAGKRKYIVQQAIRLAKINGRPYDIRVMMMRGKDRKWTYVGMVAKVAGKDSVITNVARGKGYVIDVDTALQRSLGYGPQKIKQIKKQMSTLGYDVVHKFDQYKKYWHVGLDTAVDVNGKVWMIEQNTNPAHSLFNKIPDKTIYRHIQELTAAFRARQRQAGVKK